MSAANLQPATGIDWYVFTKQLTDEYGAVNVESGLNAYARTDTSFRQARYNLMHNQEGTLCGDLADAARRFFAETYGPKQPVSSAPLTERKVEELKPAAAGQEEGTCNAATALAAVVVSVAVGLLLIANS